MSSDFPGWFSPGIAISTGGDSMKIRESAENYLEVILILGQNGSQVRSVDIAAALDFTKASVSIAMKKLRQDAYIETDTTGHISLTEAGRKIAESIYEKHTLISNWLISLGVEEQTAIDDACAMEHVLSDESFLAIKKHIGECCCGDMLR